MARFRNASLVRSRRMELLHSDSGRIPFPEGRFNKILTMHTIYFWLDLQAQINEICRVMSNEGRLVIGYTPAEDEQFVRAFPKSVYNMRSVKEIESVAAQAGLHEVRTISQSLSPNQLALTVAHKRLAGSTAETHG